jgi:methyl-accepting chemotaxis protein
MNLHRIASIRAKLFTGFGLVVALLAAVVAVSDIAMGGLGSAQSRVSHKVVPEVLAVDEVRTAAADMHFSQTRYVLASPYRSDFEADRKVYLRDLAALKQRTEPRLMSEYQAILAADARWMAVDAKIWDAVRFGNTTEASALVTGIGNDLADKLVESFTNYQTAATADKRAADAEFSSTRSSASWTIGILGCLALLAAVGIALLLARGLSGAARQMLRAANGIAEGDVEQTIDVRSNDELGQTAAAFGRMIDYLKDMAGAASTIASGDLTVNVEPRSERDLLANSFQRMTGSLRSAIGEVTKAASTMGASSQQMAATSDEAGRAIGEIAHAVTEVSQGAERQVQMVEHAKTSSDGSRQAAEQAQAVAEAGVTTAEEATTAMRELRSASLEVSETIQHLAAKSGQIGGIVETITGIAGQTNLLALNAAIEAARAGEQGRGFAVVAEEVRKLAEESQRAAASISDLIAQIQSETQRAVEVVEQGAQRTDESTAKVEATREAFQQIGLSISEMTNRIAEIAAATDEVASVAEQSSASTQQVSASTEQTSASAEEIAASAQELAGTAQHLERLVAQFQI